MTSEVNSVTAAVQVGDRVTSYLRCGRGRETVVLLCIDPTRRGALARSLADRKCVIAPECTVSRGAAVDEAFIADWITELIDGLGLVDPVLLLDPALGDVDRLTGALGGAVRVVPMPWTT